MKKIELQCMTVTLYAVLHIEQVDIIIMNYQTSVLNVAMPRHIDHAANIYLKMEKFKNLMTMKHMLSR